VGGANGQAGGKAVLYARVSTEEQAKKGYSLAQQLEALREYAAQDGYEVLAEVYDEGWSGAYLERPGLDRVRNLVEAGGVSVVLAQDRDRFAREPAYHYLLRKEFEERGTKIQALNDRGDGSPEGELTDGILDQLAKFERAKMMERTRRGKQRKAREGRIIATRAAFGFDFNTTRDGYVVNPNQMEIVKHVFYMAGVEKATIYAIRMNLKRMGLKTPSGKADWDHTFVRGLLLNDLYKPHTFAEIRRIVSPDVADRLDPEARYGVWWSGRRAFQRKLVSKNTPDGRRYKYRYKVTERAPEGRIGVPVPDSGIPRDWVDAAREALKNNRRPARAGYRDWELSGGILRCTECGRSMTARTCPKPESGRTYLYYTCVAGAYQRRDTCSARTHHKAELVEARIWAIVSRVLKDPQRLRAGLDYMIEEERRDANLAGDTATESAEWLEKLSEVGRKRARYQDMAAEGLIDFEELRTRLAALEDKRKTAEQELRALKRRTEHLAQLERDRDRLLENYAGLMPEAIDALGSQERYRVYRMIGMEAHLAADGSFELSGDVMNFSRMEISSS
jgi:site-specific DNA recombinase